MCPRLYPKLSLLAGVLLLSCGPRGDGAESRSDAPYLSLTHSLSLAQVDLPQERWSFVNEEAKAGLGWRYGDTFEADGARWVPADRRALGSIPISPGVSEGRVTARTVRAKGADLRARIREGEVVWAEFVVGPQGASAILSIPPGGSSLNRQLTFEWERLEGAKGSKNRVAWGEMEWKEAEEGSSPRVNLEAESLGFFGGSEITWDLRLPSPTHFEVPRLAR